MSPSISAPVAGSKPTCPEMKSRLPARMAGLYGPIGFAASGAETACRISGRLGDFARAQAPGAHPDPFGGAVDQCPHRLEVRLETPGPDVMGVGDRPADDRFLPADCALLGHDFLWI